MSGVSGEEYKGYFHVQRISTTTTLHRTGHRGGLWVVPHKTSADGSQRHTRRHVLRVARHNAPSTTHKMAHKARYTIYHARGHITQGRLHNTEPPQLKTAIASAQIARSTHNTHATAHPTARTGYLGIKANKDKANMALYSIHAHQTTPQGSQPQSRLATPPSKTRRIPRKQAIESIYKHQQHRRVGGGGTRATRRDARCMRRLHHKNQRAATRPAPRHIPHLFATA